MSARLLALICVALATLWGAALRAQTAGTARPSVAAAARAPAPSRGRPNATQPRGTPALRRELAALIGNASRSGDWGVAVVSLTVR